MIGKLITSILAFLVVTTTFANTCPNVQDIQHNRINGWKVYDSDDGTPLSLAREKQFKKMIEEFALAEWTNEKNKKNSIHCYYKDKTGSSLEAYLSKDNVLPENNKNYWYRVSGFMHCAAGKDKCEFMDKFLNSNKHLASRT